MGHKATHIRRDFRSVDKAERKVVAFRNRQLDEQMDVALAEDELRERPRFEREPKGPVGEQLSLVA